MLLFVMFHPFPYVSHGAIWSCCSDTLNTLVFRFVVPIHYFQSACNYSCVFCHVSVHCNFVSFLPFHLHFATFRNVAIFTSMDFILVKHLCTIITSGSFLWRFSHKLICLCLAGNETIFSYLNYCIYSSILFIVTF